MSDQRFTIEEAEAILKRAAQIHSEASRAGDSAQLDARLDEDGFTLETLRSIALEAGIHDGTLSEAINEVRHIPPGFDGPSRRSRSRLGTVVERELPFALTDDEWMAIVRAARRLSGHQGRFEYVPNNIELIWTSLEKQGDLNPCYNLASVRSGRRSLVHLEVITHTAEVLMMFVGIACVGFAALAAGNSPSNAIILAVVGLLLILGTRFGIRRIVNRAARELDNAVDSILENRRQSQK